MVVAGRPLTTSSLSPPLPTPHSTPPGPQESDYFVLFVVILASLLWFVSVLTRSFGFFFPTISLVCFLLLVILTNFVCFVIFLTDFYLARKLVLFALLLFLTYLILFVF